MKVHTLGSIARQTIGQQQEVYLLGTTSQGAFLRTAANRVLYLTGSAERGPLTLNLDGMLPGLREIPGDPVNFLDERLWFAKTNLSVSLHDAEEWRAPPTAQVELAPEEIRVRLEVVARLVRAQMDADTAALLSAVSQALHVSPAVQTAALIERLLGRGSGLTPEGDDVVAGFLLVLSRWRHYFAADLTFEAINGRLMRAARDKTTALSASLIECAALGQADERLLTGLDGLMTGIPDVEACAACFNRWGSSSGGNVFFGIRAALAS